MSQYSRKPAERRTERDNKLREIQKTKRKVRQVSCYLTNFDEHKKILLQRLEKLEMLAVELGNMSPSNGTLDLKSKAIETINFAQEIRSKL